jgi:hypothetical protein
VAGHDGLDAPRDLILDGNQAVGVVHQDPAPLTLAHELVEGLRVAMKAILVVEPDCCHVPGRGGPNPLHQGEVARPPRGFLARAVGILEVLDGKTLELRSSNNRVQLVLQ